MTQHSTLTYLKYDKTLTLQLSYNTYLICINAIIFHQSKTKKDVWLNSNHHLTPKKKSSLMTSPIQKSIKALVDQKIK